MDSFSRRRWWAGIFHNEGSGQGPKSPWGGRPGGGDGGGGGNAGGGGNPGGGPRNPWAFPPTGPRSKPGATSLDEFLKRARRGGGPGGTGGGFPANFGSGRLWAVAIALLVVLWIVLTSFHLIRPQERGVVTVFGSYSTTLEPGWRMTLPAPLASVETIDVTNIRTENFPLNGAAENLMLTQDQNIVDLDYSVRWDIASPERFAFQIAEPTRTVRDTAESAMRAVIATVTLDQAIGRGRGAIESRVAQEMQRILDDYNSGILIQGVALKKTDPPAQVNDAYRAVIAAQQRAEATTNRARAYAQQVIARAQGGAALFDNIYEQYRLAPDVTRRRLYYETMEEVLRRSDKTVIEAPGVTPYLPLPGIARRPAEPTPPAAQGQTAQPQPQGGTGQ